MKLCFEDIVKWWNWRLIRAHLCTLAVAVSFTSTWRLPKLAFRYGGLLSGLIYTITMVVVTMSSVLLQLALGQLSQQDVVGVWRAVPFFTGIGYIKLLTSLVYSICTISYLAVCVTYVFFLLSSYSEYSECRDTEELEENATIYNTSSCHNLTLLASVREEPEYYVAMALIVIVLWVLFPFILYNPIKWMKRLFYVFGPLVFLLGVTIVSSIGDKAGMTTFMLNDDWHNIKEPSMWLATITQALLSSQVATGYLVSAGDSIYASTDVEWSSLGIVGANLIMCWCGIIFWFGISGDMDKDTSNLAVLAQTLHVAIDKKLSAIWPLLMLIMFILSGMISMLTLLYPLYDRVRRVGGSKWRYITISSSVVAAAVTLAVLAVGPSLLTLLEDIFVPLLVAISTSIEIYAFVFVYGWKNLVEDVEFLTERKLIVVWVFGWYVAPAIIIPFTIWWASSWFIEQPNWEEPPWEASGLVSALCLSLFIFVALGVMSVAKQVQYDIISKIKSSFKPSRHWGPRDPITHYYWLTRRDEPSQTQPRTRYRRRKLGQFSRSTSLFNILQDEVNEIVIVEKKRANSDDFLFTQRKQNMAKSNLSDSRRRSKSLDWSVVSQIKDITKQYLRHNEVGRNIITELK